MGKIKYDWKLIEIDFKNGMSTTDICIKFGAHRSVVTRRFKRLGYNTKRSRRFLRPFSNITNRNDRDYWLGFLLADGYITHQKGKVSQLGLGLSSKDIEHLRKFSVFLGVSVKEYHYKYKSCRVTYIHPEEIPYLISLGITSLKTFKGPLLEEMNWDVLRGIIDGDGSPNKATIQISSSNKCIVKQITDFLVKEGVQCVVRIDNKNTKKGLTKDHYTIRILSILSINKSVFNKLYPEGCVKLERKYNKLRVYYEKS